MTEKKGRTVNIGTVKVLRSAVARLSPDLVFCKQFRVHVDREKKRVRLERLDGNTRPWRFGALKLVYSNAVAKSPLISFKGVLRELGLSPEKARGEYRAWKTRTAVVIDMSRKLQNKKRSSADRGQVSA